MTQLSPEDDFSVNVLGARPRPRSVLRTLPASAPLPLNGSGPRVRRADPRLQLPLRHHLDPMRAQPLQAPSIPSGPIRLTNLLGITDDQKVDVDIQMGEYRDAYDAALQALAGKFPDPSQVTEAARAIGEEAAKTLTTRKDDYPPEVKEALVSEYHKFFVEAIQSIADKGVKAKDVVAKAHKVALASIAAEEKERARLGWNAVQLPQPMGADCVVDPGKMHGPKNIALCKTHEHVMDTDAKMVIAHTVAEYQASQKKAPAGT